MPLGRFRNFKECVEWAKKEGKKNPEAYCGALEHNAGRPRRASTFPRKKK